MSMIENITNTISGWKDHLSITTPKDVTKTACLGLVLCAITVPIASKPVKPLVKRGITELKKGNVTRAMINFSVATAWAAGITCGFFYIYSTIATRIEHLKMESQQKDSEQPKKDEECDLDCQLEKLDELLEKMKQQR